MVSRARVRGRGLHCKTGHLALQGLHDVGGARLFDFGSTYLCRRETEALLTARDTEGRNHDLVEQFRTKTQHNLDFTLGDGHFLPRHTDIGNRKGFCRCRHARYCKPTVDISHGSELSACHLHRGTDNRLVVFARHDNTMDIVRLGHSPDGDTKNHHE